MNNYTIWCTYHKPEFINEYNLKETDNFKLFYTLANYKGISLNYAQLYFNEWVTQYYVWKNQIKSDYVGFCHYRRKFDVDENIENILKSNDIYMYEYELVPQPLYYHFENLGLGYSINILLDAFIKLNYYNKFDNYKKYLMDKNAHCGWKELYICKWDIFNEMMIFINNFIKFIMKTNNELYEIDINEYNNVSNELNNINYNMFKNYHILINDFDYFDGPFFGYPRCLAYLIEHIIGIYLNCLYKYNT